MIIGPKHLVLVLLFSIGGNGLFAQKEVQSSAEFNVIKRDKDYIYAEATMSTQEEAMELARDMLNDKIKTYVSTQKKLQNSEAFVAKNYASFTEGLSLQRGSMMRVVVYIKKSDIIPVESLENVEIISNDKVPAGVEVEESVPEEVTLPPLQQWQEDTLKQLLGIVSFNEVQGVFQSLKAQGKLAGYGKYATMTNPEKCYLLIYNKEGEVKATLSRPNPEKRVNMHSMQTDDVANYKGCGALWFILSD